MSTTPTFGHWLKQRRKALGLTQKELAQRAICAEVTVRKIEAGELTPSTPLVAALAKTLGAADADLPELEALARGTGDDFASKARLLRPQRPNNLTAQLTPLIGRSHDISAVRKRLIDDGARLITLLGPPGVGKTRLALAVAEDVLEHFEHGAFFIRLAPINDPTLVAFAVAQTLGLQMGGSNPPEMQLRVYLEEKHVLLVLDNFEHLVAAAPLVDDLLRRCPWLHVLVTSRQPLRIRGERQAAVMPLALPHETPAGTAISAANALAYPAVALFADRAEAVQSDFTVSDANAAAVAELCRRLDGLPLAIELVAARVKLLPPADLLPRLRGPWLLSADGLRDVSARQKTLRGAIGWSYDLLSRDEQTFFMRLAVFPGGCTLAAAEMVCGDTLAPPLPHPLAPSQVLDGIASLLDKSLLHRETSLHGRPHYVMLETVREYGLERLAASEQQEAVRARHAACFLRLVEYAEQTDPNPGQLLLAELVDDEIHSVRTALVWAIEHDDQAALLLTAALLKWSFRLGSYSEGTRVIDEVLALPGAAAPTIPRAKTLIQAGYRFMTGNTDAKEAQAFAEDALALSRKLGYVQGEADALVILGRIVHRRLNDPDAARRLFTEALACYRTLDNAGGIAYALAMLGDTALDQGDFPRAQALAEECLETARRGGFAYPWPLATLANVAWGEGDLETARSLYEQRLTVLRVAGFKGALANVLAELGALATRQGDFTAAHAFLDEAAVYLEKIGSEAYSSAFRVFIAALAQAEGNYRDAIRWYRESLAGMRHYLARWWGSCLLHLAALAEALDQYELAARLLGAIQPVEETIKRLYPIEREEYNRLADTTRAHLGAVHFDTAWTKGREGTFDQVVEEALSILEAVVRNPAESSQ